MSTPKCFISYSWDSDARAPIAKASNEQKNGMSSLVKKVVSLNTRLTKIGEKLTDERTRIENEIEKIDRQIDELVYEIYEIDETEQRIIEDSL